MGDCCNRRQQVPKKPGLRVNESSRLELESKVVLLGETYVGKSSIALRLMSNLFDDNHNVTIGGAYLQPMITLKNSQKIKLHLWDTGGEERFRTMLKLYYRDSQAAIIVYDVCNPHSFNSVEYWLNELEEQTQRDNMIIYIVGNKIDMPSEEIKISLKQAREKYVINSNIKVHLFETSAQTGQNIRELFQDLSENLYANLVHNNS